VRRVTLVEAGRLVENGGVVATATDTPVGLLASALDADAVARVIDIKGKQRSAPIPVLVRVLQMALALAESLSEEGLELARSGWPGPLTLVVRARRGVFPEAVTAGGATVGLRQPGTSPALELLRLVNRPLTGTSANLTGASPARGIGDLAPSVARMVAGLLGEASDLGTGRASRVIDVSGAEMRIIRA